MRLSAVTRAAVRAGRLPPQVAKLKKSPVEQLRRQATQLIDKWKSGIVAQPPCEHARAADDPPAAKRAKVPFRTGCCQHSVAFCQLPRLCRPEHLLSSRRHAPAVNAVGTGGDTIRKGGSFAWRLSVGRLVTQAASSKVSMVEDEEMFRAAAPQPAPRLSNVALRKVSAIGD